MQMRSERREEERKARKCLREGEGGEHCTRWRSLCLSHARRCRAPCRRREVPDKNPHPSTERGREKERELKLRFSNESSPSGHAHSSVLAVVPPLLLFSSRILWLQVFSWNLTKFPRLFFKRIEETNIATSFKGGR